MAIPAPENDNDNITEDARHCTHLVFGFSICLWKTQTRRFGSQMILIRRPHYKYLGANPTTHWPPLIPVIRARQSNHHCAPRSLFYRPGYVHTVDHVIQAVFNLTEKSRGRGTSPHDIERRKRLRDLRHRLLTIRSGKAIAQGICTDSPTIATTALARRSRDVKLCDNRPLRICW